MDANRDGELMLWNATYENALEKRVDCQIGLLKAIFQLRDSNRNWNTALRATVSRVYVCLFQVSFQICIA